MGWLFYRIRGHDSRQIILTSAFKDLPEPNMTLDATECGPSGSKLLLHHTCLAEDGIGCMPDFQWTPPETDQPVQEYVLICEDLDLPIPFLVIHHGLFWGIRPSVTRAGARDASIQQTGPNVYKTIPGWNFIPNLRGTPYIGAAAPLGHGPHRYVFTIIALNARLDFPQPQSISKSDIKRGMVGKVIGWGQWTGIFERPWPS
ncbi:Phosphatidylethanolamine-binding protein PEBP [Penicillium capsulatum]|uniref:Phosphatidylethanolamine-binding protein PEBP n=1 Tax=Penicillium capsulatum TaxID=69766 RepID=A0A9W9IUX1_9EURO|nr:Phosphatidylethanolamine-binding protein PEBP [Penicillium capsulatum]